jgi:hypothetical protein
MMMTSIASRHAPTPGAPQLILMSNPINILSLQIACAKEMAYCYHGTPLWN